MSQGEYIAVLGGIIALLLTIIGYFLHRSLTQVDDSIKSLETQAYKDATRLEKLVNQYNTDLKTLIHMIDSGLKVNQTSLTHLQKRMDDLANIEKEINEVMLKVISNEAKIEQLGKIIYVGKNGK